MALDLRGVTRYPYFKTLSLDISTLEIKLPPSARKITIGSETKKLYLSQNGATDAGTLPADYIFVPASNLLALNIGVGLENPGSVYVSVSTGTGTAHILIEE